MARRLPIRRELRDGDVVYLRRGRRVTAARELERIAALAVPPAWTDVEIAAGPRAKVQAIGTDDAGRRQRIYSEAHRRRRERVKHDRVLAFADALPRLRQQVDRDLRRRTLSRARVVAAVVRLIDEEGFRVGSEAYRREHGSYGVTTLRRRHVRVRSASVEFDFAGKLGQRQRRVVRDPRLARLLARLESLPGGVLFASLDAEGRRHAIRAAHVNAYIQEHTGTEGTAKDLRTWSATRAAAALLLDAEQDELERDAPALVRAVVREVAERLGNTPAVARESYIDPRVLGASERPELIARVRRQRASMRPRRHRSTAEQAALALLRSLA